MHPASNGDNDNQVTALTPSRLAKGKRISAHLVREALEAAEKEFGWCHQALVEMKKPAQHDGLGKTILDFQPRLRNAIENLESTFRAIKQEEKRLIANKARYNTAWFQQRMSRLASYSKSLNEGLAIGRAIGDGFAWIFYQQDRELIDEHLKLQRQPLLPPAIGALGEKLTLENMRGWDGKLLIYHGATTFLRMGDFSLVDLTTSRIACIGELKTQRVDEQQVSVSISLVAGDPEQLPGLPEFPKREGQDKEKPAPPLPAKMQARFKRQTKEIHEAILRANEGQAERVIPSRAEFHFAPLESVVRRSHTKAFEFEKADDGFLIGALRLPAETTLADNLMGENGGNFNRAVSNAPEWVMKILSPNISDNSISMCTLGGAEYLPMGRTCPPLLAWPLDPEIIADILFGRVIVVTFFNRAHLIAKIRERGFEVRTDGKGRLAQAKKLVSENKQLALEHFDYILSLVQQSLMSEASVLALVDETISSSIGLGEDGPSRVELRTRIA